VLKRRGLLLLAGGSGLGAASAPGKRLLLVNDAYPPFVMPAGEPAGEGIDVDLLREALAPAGYTLELRLLPWRRALAMLEQGEADLTTTVSLSADRDAYLAYSIGYRRRVPYHFYALAGRGLRVDSMADLSGFRLGLAAGFRYPPVIEAAVAGNIDRARDLANLAGLLAAGRVDLICGNGLPLAWAIRQQGLSDRVQRMRYEYLSRSSTYMGMAKRRHAEDGPLIKALDAGLARLLKRGRVAALERHYLGRL
jgi:polar amino acid transport system substrate-binding protein